MKKPKRKMLMIEVETVLSNAKLRRINGIVCEDERGTLVECDWLDSEVLRIVQVHVNDAGPSKAKRNQ